MTSLAVVQAGTAYPLAAYGRVEMEWDGVIGKADVADNALDVPEDTLIFVDQTPKSRIFTVRMVIVGATEAAVNDSLAQLAGLVWSPTDPILFRRVIPYTAGNQTSEVYAYLVSPFRPIRPPGGAPNTANLALDFRMLTADWYVGATPTVL